MTNEYTRKMSPDPIEIGQLATRCGAKRLVITHLRSSMDEEETRTAMLGELKSHFFGDAGIAEDLLSIQL